MRKSNQAQFRELLRLHSDGLTSTELSKMSGTRKEAALVSLKCMPDAYIDRWINIRGQDAGIWCVVIPPENCPKPERKTR
jgi:hypothetical protein